MKTLEYFGLDRVYISDIVHQLTQYIYIYYILTHHMRDRSAESFFHLLFYYFFFFLL